MGKEMLMPKHYNKDGVVAGSTHQRKLMGNLPGWRKASSKTKGRKEFISREGIKASQLKITIISNI